MLQAWTKLETEKDNWKPSHRSTVEQSCKQGDKSANCWWNVSVGLLLNKVANCQTLLHFNRSQWPSHIRIAAGLSVCLPTFVKIIRIRILFQQTSLSRWKSLASKLKPSVMINLFGIDLKRFLRVFVSFQPMLLNDTCFVLLKWYMLANLVFACDKLSNTF